VIGLAQLMIMLDTTIMNIALPSAQHALNMSDANRQWVVTAYTLASGGLLLLGGRVADMVGRKRTFLIGVVGFIAASALGGLSPVVGVLIAARGLQGMFAALLGPSTLAMITATFTEPHERAKAFGVFSSVAAAGGAIGLVLGGIITQLLSWRWVFFINLPIGVVIAIGGLLVLPAVAGHKLALDIPGAVLATLGTVAMIYGFGEAASKGWGSGQVIVSLIAALVLLAAFVYVQRRSANPLLPLHLLANRNRAGAFLSIALAMVGLFGLFLFMTYQLQVIMKFSPLKAGLALLPATVVTVLVNTQVTPRLLPRVPARWLVAPGLVIASCGLLIFTQLTPDSTYAGYLLPAQLLLGGGLGLVITPCVNIATSGLPMKDIGVMAAFVGASQQIGASTGTALLNTIAASTTAAALVGAGTAPAVVARATVHGFAVASAWGVGILLVAAILAGSLINVNQRK
jgi:EmrB/QacA subfamily drug resistance transporter